MVARRPKAPHTQDHVPSPTKVKAPRPTQDQAQECTISSAGITSPVLSTRGDKAPLSTCDSSHVVDASLSGKRKASSAEKKSRRVPQTPLGLDQGFLFLLVGPLILPSCPTSIHSSVDACSWPFYCASISSPPKTNDEEDSGADKTVPLVIHH
jgi:hypothetical protein